MNNTGRQQVFVHRAFDWFLEFFLKFLLSANRNAKNMHEAWLLQAPGSVSDLYNANIIQ